MDKESIKALFSFSRRERTGVLVLLLCVAFAFIWPCFLSSPAAVPDKKLVWQLSRQLAARLDSASEMGKEDADARGDGEGNASDDGAQGKWKNGGYVAGNGPVPRPILFDFDPNTLSAGGWKKLGLKERTVNTVMHYMARGGKFRKVEDLKKLYGLSPEMYERLAPFVKIVQAPEKDSAGKAGQWAYRDNSHNGYGGKGGDRQQPVAGISGQYPTIGHGRQGLAIPATRPDPVIDMNGADSAAWEALPGIGGRLAQRIIRFREKLGGFYSVNQLADIYGLPDTVFRQLQPFLKCGAWPLKKININTAEAKELKQHPYMSWNMANLIVQYRHQHGPFRSPQELLQVAVTDTVMWKKILPYVNTE